MKIKLSEPCSKCQSLTGKIERSGPHNKLSCAVCNSFIKFLSHVDFQKIKNPIPEKSEKITLNEINFKLDVIMDYLNLTQKENLS